LMNCQTEKMKIFGFITMSEKRRYRREIPGRTEGCIPFWGSGTFYNPYVNKKINHVKTIRYKRLDPKYAPLLLGFGVGPR
jgi:hypothetical protein